MNGSAKMVPPGSPASLHDAGLARALVQAVDDAFENEQVPLFRALVEQPSHTRARDDVEAGARIVDEVAARLGLVRTLVPDPQRVFADHRVFATKATREGDRALALVGHVDTVFPRAMGFFGFTREGDVVRGPGVLDMKSGLSAILFALQAVRRVLGPRGSTLRARFVCNTDEEVGSPSSEPLFRTLAPRTSSALVFEAGRTGDRIVTARKGGGLFELEVVGRAAHAGNDHAGGISAIHALALLVPRIEALTDYARGVTLNVGTIEGGSAKNTVPERARCTIDARFCTDVDARAVTAALQAIADRPFGPNAWAPTKLREVQASLRGGVTRPPMEPVVGTQELRARYERHAAAVGLGVGEAPLQGGGSDANLLAAHGVPTIDGLGPYGQHFHSPKEWSSLDSLRRRTQALALVLAEEAEGGAR